MAQKQTLSPKQRKFVAEYLKDFNGTKAAIRAGYAPRSARVAAARLLAIDAVSEILTAKAEKVIQKVEIEAEDVLRELAYLGRSDIRELFDADGNVLPVAKWPESLAKAVSSVEVVLKNVAAGDGVVDRVLKVKLWPKDRALEMLARHKALFPKETVQENNLTVINMLGTGALDARIEELTLKLAERRGMRLVKAG